jgi:alkylated DNA repair dioxygenase AlkB
MNNGRLVYDSDLGNQTLYLTQDLSSWIHIDYLPNELKEYAFKNFNSMFDLHPENKANVLVFNKDKQNPDWNEIECFRWSKSYLNTPKFDKTVMKSYMFSGTNDENINDELPELFKPFYDFMKTKDDRNNQVIANWYGNNEDYIPFHSDCEADMVDNHTISLINFNSDDKIDSWREFKLITRDTNNSLYDEVVIVLRHGLIITMGGNVQTKYTHGVPKCDNNLVSQRISLSFRQF